MKMKNYRLFLLGFTTASLIFLTGFEKAGVKNAPSKKKQTALIGVKTNQPKSKENHVNLKQRKKTNKQKSTSVPNPTENAELQKSLDLSVPFKIPENTWLKTEQNRRAQVESSNMFAAEKKKKQLPLYLDGQMLMSQEPENDKKKSLDGAGIVINLKR